MERAFHHLNTNLNYVDKLCGCIGRTSTLLNGVVLLQTLLAVALLGAAVPVLVGAAPGWAVGGGPGPRLVATAALVVGVVLVGALFVYAFALEAFARRVHRKVTLIYENAGYRENSMTDPGCSPFRRVDVLNMLLGAPRANGAGGGGDPLLGRLGASVGVFHAVALALLLPLGAQAAAAAALASLHGWAWWAWIPPAALILAALAHALGVIRYGLRRATTSETSVWTLGARDTIATHRRA